MLRHSTLIALIICALLLGEGPQRTSADEGLEPGVTSFVDGTASALQGPPEPSAHAHFEEEEAVVEAKTDQPALEDANIPEPSSNPAFSAGNNSSARVQAAPPPEPSTRPHFTENQGPPEPSTRPAFTPSHPDPIPEPSTRPVLSDPEIPAHPVQAPPEPSTRPHFTSNQSPPQSPPPEPSTRPHFSSGAPSRVQAPLEPSTRPHFTDNTVHHQQADPRQRSKPQNNPTSRPRSRPLYTSYYSGPSQVAVGVGQPIVRVPPSRVQVYPNYTPRPLEPGHNRYQETARPLEPGHNRYQAETPNPSEYHHLYDHPSLVNTRLDRPFSQSVWKCDLSVNGCFLKSKHNFVPFTAQYAFEGTRQALVLDIGRAARKRHSLTRRPNPVYSYAAARLETTSYFPAQYADACIAFSYFWNGSTRKNLHVLQRNIEDVCIYSASVDPSDPTTRPTSGAWQDVQLQLNLRYGPAKFWIESQFDIGDKTQGRAGDYYPTYQDLGFIAIRNFSIGYGTCQNNAAEECDVPSSRR